MTTFFTDTSFKRIVNAERRVNQGLFDVDITANYTLEAYSHDFLSVTNSAATTLNINLPDATTLPLGFDLKVRLVSGLSIGVVPSGGVSLKAIESGKTYGFRLLENSTAAGTWLIYSVGIDADFVVAYVKNFNATSDWTDETSHWSVSVPATEHFLGTQPLTKVYELISTGSGGTFTLATNAGGEVLSFAVDSATQSIYVGGNFTEINGTAVTNLALISLTDGVVSEPVTVVDAPIRTLAFRASDSSLFIGGEFTTIGDHISGPASVSRVARLDSSGQISSLGTGCNGIVNVIKLDASGNAYLGGAFTTAGSVSANRIAFWNGSTFTALGSGCDAAVKAIRINGGDVYVAGDFTTCGGISTNYIATWNGSWAPFSVSTGSAPTPTYGKSSNGADGAIFALANDSEYLYVGGQFNFLLGTPCNCIARVNLTTLECSPLGPTTPGINGTIGLNSIVTAISVDAANNKVYIGGDFTEAYDSVSMNRIACWDGVELSSLGTGCDNIVHAIAIDSANGRVYIGGSFTTANGVSASRIAYWNVTTSTFVPLGVGCSSSVYSLALDSANSKLYVGGSFDTAGGITVNRICYWDTLTSTFTVMATGGSGSVYCIAIDSTNNRVYIGGDYGNTGITRICYWNGSALVALGTGCNNMVRSIYVGSDRVYVGGAFTSANGVTVSRLAYWDLGLSTFVRVGTLGDTVNALLGHPNGKIYAGGLFTSTQADPYNRICSVTTNGAFRSLALFGGGAIDTSGGSAYINSMAKLGDDLYVGGSFSLCFGVSCRNVAKLNLTTLECNPLGTGCDAGVKSIVADAANNRVYFGGDFTSANNITVNRIAYWNGSTFVAMGVGCNGTVEAIAIDSPNNRVYVGGSFTTANNVTVNRITYWNGSTFVAMGTGCVGAIYAIAVDSINNRVYIGGWSNTANGVTINKIGFWNGSTFVALGTGCDNSVYCIALDGVNNRVYISGDFTTANGVTVNRVAYWNGSTFVALGTGCNNPVRNVVVDPGNSRVYIGGSFTTANGVTANRVAYWNGSTFVALGMGVPNGSGGTLVYSLLLDYSTNRLYVSGSIQGLDDVQSNSICCWDVTQSSALPLASVSIGAGSTIHAFCRAGTDLYVGGWFNYLLGTRCNYIGKIDLLTLECSSLGTGCDNGVMAISYSAEANPRLYIGGYFTTANGVSASRVAYWDFSTSTFVAMGTGCNGPVNAICASQYSLGNVFIGGLFSTADGVTVNRIALWNGSAFAAMGAGCDAAVYAITEDTSNGRMYVGGDFLTANSVTVNRIAYWNGSTFVALGTGCNAVVRAIAMDVGNTSVLVGGEFTTAGGASRNRIARWDGSTFTAFGTGCSYTVHTICVPTPFTPGAFWIGGEFTTANGVQAQYLTYWTGSTFAAFVPLQSINGGIVYAICSADTGLFVGGAFTACSGFNVNNMLYFAKTLNTPTAASVWKSVGALPPPPIVGANAPVSAVEFLSSRLYLGGEFTSVGGVAANRIAYWDGATFSALGTGCDSPVFSFAVEGSLLYVGGSFANAGGVAVNKLATWDGSAFSAVARAGTVDVLAVTTETPDPFYAGASFNYGTTSFGLIPTGGDLQLDSSGDVTLSADQTPDMRFAGRVVIRV